VTSDLRLPSRSQSTASAPWPVLISRFPEGRRLSWPEWLVPFQDGILANARVTEVSNAAFYWARELVFTVNTTCRPVPNRSRELEISIVNTSRELDENYAPPLLTR